jgi:MFS family permease
VPLLFLALVLLFTWEPEESEHLVDHSVEGRWRDIPWGLMGIICLITLFGGVMFYFVQIKLSDALSALGVSLPDGSYDSARGGLFIMLASAGVPLGTLCFWGLAPRLKLKSMFLLEFVLMGVGFLLMSMIKTPLYFALAAALNQIGAGMLLPTLLTWAVSTLPFEIRGRGTGIWTATFALAQFACNNMAVPLIMGFTHGIIPTIGVLGWMCVGAAGVALLMRMKSAND